MDVEQQVEIGIKDGFSAAWLERRGCLCLRPETDPTNPSENEKKHTTIQAIRKLINGERAWYQRMVDKTSKVGGQKKFIARLTDKFNGFGELSKSLNGALKALEENMGLSRESSIVVIAVAVSNLVLWP